MNSFLENRPLAAGRSAGFAPVPTKAETSFRPLFSPGSSRPQIGGIGAELTDEAPAAEEPQVELVQNGGKVEKIIVTCSCCKRIELRCQY